MLYTILCTHNSSYDMKPSHNIMQINKKPTICIYFIDIVYIFNMNILGYTELGFKDK